MGLRKKRVKSLNDLLTVLGPRSTSWPRDMAIIASLLVGIQKAVGEKQQEIYQEILRKIGWVAHGHLFHRSATMASNFSWCPTNLLTLPMADISSQRKLKILDNGNLWGKWDVIQPLAIPRERYVLYTGFPLVDMRINMTLESGSQCMLLGEPDTILFNRAIAVRTLSAKHRLYAFMGPVYFNPPLGRDEFKWESWYGITIGCEEKRQDSPQKAPRYTPRLWKKEPPSFTDLQRPLAQMSNKWNRESSPMPEDRRLLEAVIEGNKSEVRHLLRYRGDVDFQDDAGWTAMHHAVTRGHHGIIDLLIDKVHKLDIQDELGQQSLHLAAERGDDNLLMRWPQLMDGHQPCKDGQTALHRAVLGESLSVVKILLDRFHTDIMDAQDSLGRSALHLSAELGRKAIMAELIYRNARMELKDNSGRTVLHYATMNCNNDPEILETLLDYEILETLQEYDILNLPDNDGRMPLHYAADIGYVGYLEVLVQKTHLGATDSLGRTALEVAADAGHLPVVRFLLDRDTERKELPQSSLDAALHLAASVGILEIVEALVGHGASIWSRDSMDKTALEKAVELKHPTVTIYLAEFVLWSDRSGEVPAGWVEVARTGPPVIEPTALLYAVSRGYTKVTEALIERGEDIFETDEDGRTVLSLAVTNTAESAIKALVAAYGKAITSGVTLDVIARAGAATRQQLPFDYWSYSMSSMPGLADIMSTSWVAVKHLEQAFYSTSDSKLRELLIPKLEPLRVPTDRPMALGEPIAPSSLYGMEIYTERVYRSGQSVTYAPAFRNKHRGFLWNAGDAGDDEDDEDDEWRQRRGRRGRGAVSFSDSDSEDEY